MKKRLIPPDYVAFKEYWDLAEQDRPQSFAELCELLLPQPGIRGIWEVTAIDRRSGNILQRSWLPNAITDNGAQYAIGNLFAAAGATYAPMNVMCISTEAGSSTLTSALTASSSYTSLAVNALPNAIPANAQLVLDYGTASAETVATTAGASASATSITGITAVGGGTFTAAHNHSIGASVVPVALVTDNPSASPAGAQYLTLVTGDFGALSGSGVGNRTRTITKLFAGATTAAATYTWCRLCNANPIVSGSVGASCIVPQAVIDSSTDQTFAVVIKL
jgi:hypothetical protein